jgi:IS1 family transposase
VGKKKRHVKPGDAPELGDQWVFVALDADTKLVPVFLVGKRSSENTQAFIHDLHQRTANRIQLTTDAFHLYRKAVEQSFGADIDFAQLTKLYGDYGQFGNERYSPSPIVEVISKVRQGNPDPKHISTSYVERQNLTMRMQMRRLTRLTNAFSKKVDNLKAAITLHFAHENVLVAPAGTVDDGFSESVLAVPDDGTSKHPLPPSHLHRHTPRYSDHGFGKNPNTHAAALIDGSQPKPSLGLGGNRNCMRFPSPCLHKIKY